MHPGMHARARKRQPWRARPGSVDLACRGCRSTRTCRFGTSPPRFSAPPSPSGARARVALEFRGGVGVLQQPQATLVLLAGGAPLLAAPWPAGSWPPGPPIFLRIFGGSRSPNYRYASSTPKVGPQARACTCRAVRTAQQVQQAHWQQQGVLAGRSFGSRDPDLDLEMSTEHPRIHIPLYGGKKNICVYMLFPKQAPPAELLTSPPWRSTPHWTTLPLGGAQTLW